jgi:hypothetical protein
MRVGDYEGLLDDDVRDLFERTREDWRDVPVEEAEALATNASRTNDGAVPWLHERIALFQALCAEIEKGRRFGAEVLNDAVVAAYGDKQAGDYLPAEKRAIAFAVQRIWSRASSVRYPPAVTR